MALFLSDVVLFDESGFYINGERQWIHTAGSSDLTYYDFHSKRGHKAMDAIGILPEFKGRAIHDLFSSFGKTKLPRDIMKKYRTTYKRIIRQGLKANPPPPKSGKRGKTAQGKPRNLLNRSNDFANETLIKITGIFTKMFRSSKECFTSERFR